MATRTLTVWINGQPVADLQDVDSFWQLRYRTEWLADNNAYALGPHLPLQTGPILDAGTLRPVQTFFDNLLPEEGQRLLLADAARVTSADSFGLLAYYGAESAGSLTLLPAGQALPADSGVQPLLFEQLSARIVSMPRIPLVQAAPKKMSLPGAQHKLALIWDGKQLWEPRGSTPSTHILKPNHDSGGFPHSVANEYFIMRLAATLGLKVPAVTRLYVPEPVYLVERFDRVMRDGQWQRRHVIDACQMLGIASGFKYSAGSIATYSRLAAQTRPPMVTSRALFQWLLFNVLVGNTDAHLKNISCLVTKDGISLAPHYDLLCTAVYETRMNERGEWPDATTLASDVLGTSRLAQCDTSRLLSVAEQLGVAGTAARSLLRGMVERIVPAAEELYEQIVLENAQLSAAQPELRAVLNGEEAWLRGIVRIIIAEMAAKLAR
jgi:serine/threonine-protein kinase HipA